MNLLLWFGIGICSIIAFSVFVYFVPIGLWIQAWTSNAHIGVLDLIAMRLRRVPPAHIVIPRITAIKAGIDLSVAEMEAHFLAGGHVGLVVQALISAQKANIQLNFQRATAIDLAGRNVLEAVQMSVLPKVITTPKITNIAKNGIQVSAYVKITVRANLDRLIGGATEETIIARVGEGVISTIGSSATHLEVLKSPDLISKHVLSKGLDSGTAFEIQSIDIADVDVGKNIGADLQTEQAEADKKIAQAHAESRRALAVAEEQEMLAQTQRARAMVVEAEAQVPLAMAQALREGKLGVMDYYSMKNLTADTHMRDAIGTSMHSKTSQTSDDSEKR